MKTKIEKLIHKELDYVLSESDIEGRIAELSDPKFIKDLIKQEIHDVIRRKVADEIEMSIYKAIKKATPFIDAYTADKVQSLMFKIDEATKKV